MANLGGYTVTAKARELEAPADLAVGSGSRTVTFPDEKLGQDLFDDGISGVRRFADMELAVFPLQRGVAF